jgi:hypothetical protein
MNGYKISKINNISNSMELEILFYSCHGYVSSNFYRIKTFFKIENDLTCKVSKNILYMPNSTAILDEYIEIIIDNIEYDLINNTIITLLKSKDIIKTTLAINLLLISKETSLINKVNKEVFGPHKALPHFFN